MRIQIHLWVQCFVWLIIGMVLYCIVLYCFLMVCLEQSHRVFQIHVLLLYVQSNTALGIVWSITA